MKSCPFVFLQACSLSVNTLTPDNLITSEADGFHSKGVMFLHSPVTAELTNALQHQRTQAYEVHSYACNAHISAHTYLTHTLSPRQDLLTKLPELSGVYIFSAFEGSCYQEIMTVKNFGRDCQGGVYGCLCSAASVEI